MNRRTLLKSALTGLGAVIAAPVMAETIIGNQCKTVLTPAQTKGPFYPRTRASDQNADLVRVDGSNQDAAGEKIIIRGRIVDDLCQPVSGALVDLWQACHTGKYNHPSDPNPAAVDPNFQYSAQILTDAEGRFEIRTIIPGAYPAEPGWTRPPHLHFRIAKLGYKELITQTYFDLFANLNEKDLILGALSKAEQESVTVEMAVPTLRDLRYANWVGDLTLTIQKVRSRT